MTALRGSATPRLALGRRFALAGYTARIAAASSERTSP